MSKVALVTGSRRGIGYGIAKCLAREGFDLVVNGTRGREDIEDRIRELESCGVRVLYCGADVAAVRADIL